jgi:flagellar motor switch protein FliN/FliY
VTTVVPTAAAELAAAAAASVAVNLASSEPLTVGEPTTDPGVVLGASSAVGAATGGAAHAMLAEFGGNVSGDLLLIIDDDLAAALRQASIGTLELPAALTPTFEAIGLALDSVALGPVTPTDVRPAIARAGARASVALVPLHGSSAVRAAVLVGTDTTTSDGAPAGSNVPNDATTEPERGAPNAERLDLLRGVEMAATAELGRTQMTVNDLLSMRPGAVIELDRAAGAAADLFVNGRLIARGEVVVVDENYGLRITQVVTDDGPR